jgi:hypothetical protein
VLPQQSENHWREVLESYVTTRRKYKEALNSMRKSMKRHRRPPILVVDKFWSCGAAMKDRRIAVAKTSLNWSDSTAWKISIRPATSLLSARRLFLFGHFIVPNVVAQTQLGWKRFGFSDTDLSALVQEFLYKSIVGGFFWDMFHEYRHTPSDTFLSRTNWLSVEWVTWLIAEFRDSANITQGSTKMRFCCNGRVSLWLQWVVSRSW